jgi:ribosomal protein S18 acetylase RimI-like enzyme
MTDIRTLQHLSPQELYEAFNLAFFDYKRSWTRSEFGNMLERRGYSAAHSYGAFEEKQLVSFILNGCGNLHGRKAAYDTGTGTIAEYRGKGLTKEIFIVCEAALRTEGFETYVLEVLQDNAKAISIYKKAAFGISREFNYYFQADPTIVGAKTPPAKIGTIHLGEIAEWQPMLDSPPSWQNNYESLERVRERLQIIGAFIGTKLAGFGVIEPSSGDIPQVYVLKESRRKGIGSMLLRELIQRNNSRVIRILNIESGCETVNAFLAYHHIGISGKQYEMVKSL